MMMITFFVMTFEKDGPCRFCDQNTKSADGNKKNNDNDINRQQETSPEPFLSKRRRFDSKKMGPNFVVAILIRLRWYMKCG